MKQYSILFILLFIFSYSSLDAKCDCKGNEVIYVCQNGQTKRVNCSALSDPNVFCGPCNQKPDCTPGEKCDDGDDCTKWDKYDNNCNCYGRFVDEDDDGVCDAKDICPDGDDLRDWDKNGMPDDCEKKETTCNECPADSDGKITICWIPGNKDNFRTIKANCDYLKNFFDDEGNLKGKNQCGPCDCAMIGDTDSDGDGICDRKDECPDNPDKSKPGPCGCDDQDSDKDWVCDKDDVCLGHNDKEDTDGDGVPDGCDVCPTDPHLTDNDGPCGCNDKDSDFDGICDKNDCAPNNPDIPTAPGTTCDDGNDETENDVILEDGCSCAGTPIQCAIQAVISDIICDDNGTPAIAADDSYSFNLTALAVEHAGSQWEGGFDNAFLGAFRIGPTNYGEQVKLGPFPAGAFTSTNTVPPIVFSNGLTINVQVNAVGDFSCEDRLSVDSPGTCACDDADGDEICDGDDLCEGYDDHEDEDNDGTPDGCDVCPDNPDLSDDDGPCGCDDVDSDGDGECDKTDCAPNDPVLPSTRVLDCDDGNPQTSDDAIAIGSCECIGIPILCPDTDGDGICNEDDICEGHDDATDSDDDGTPDGCDECPDNGDLTEKGECGCEICPPDPCDDFCMPTHAQSEYEWIDKISINQLEYESGANGGYLDNRHMYIELGHGDTVSFWLFPGFVETNCEVSMHIYADWNGDCDFDDEDELVVWKRTLNESGADIAIPYHAKPGDVTVRFMLHYGRIYSGCQPYIDGEVEDYTIKVFSRPAPDPVGPLKDDTAKPTTKSFKVAPNPVIENNSFYIDSNINNTDAATVNIISLEGDLISTFKLENGQKEFSANMLKPGVYIVELNTGDVQIKERIIVQK